jgi:hypothetical protein
MTGQLFECKHLNVISAILEFQSTNQSLKNCLNSFKEIVPNFSLNFSIFLKELLTSMVYMGVKVTIFSRIYGDGVKVGAAASIPH